MDYKDIQDANRKLKKMQIETKKGKKDYVQVHERVKGFRMLFPEGSIETELLTLKEGRCIFRAVAKDAEGKILASGTAYEDEGSTNINATSFIENAESSAVGRALSFIGLGIDSGIASFEEVTSAEQRQAENLKIGKARAEALEKELKDRGISVEKVKQLYKVAFLSDLTERYHRNIVGHFDDLKRMSDGM